MSAGIMVPKIIKILHAVLEISCATDTDGRVTGARSGRLQPITRFVGIQKQLKKDREKPQQKDSFEGR